MSLDTVKNIVLVLSGKGGVGKSSITAQLALSLSLAGHSVGILDIDLTGPSIPRLFGLENAKITQAPGGWLPVEVYPSHVLPKLFEPPPVKAEPTEASPPSIPANGNTLSNGVGAHSASEVPMRATGSLHIMSLGFLLPSRSSAVVWRGPKKTAMVRQFLTSVLWPKNLSFLLIDTPPGTSDEHISLAETLLSSTASSTAPKLAGALIVTTPQAVAVSDVRKEINFCHKTGVSILGVVENMSGYVCECCGVSTNLFGKGGGEIMGQECGIRFLGRVPVDAQWGILVEEGRRPKYGGVAISSGEQDKNANRTLDEDSSTEDAAPETSSPGDTVGTDGESDTGLLVDKYRSCSLCPIFRDITHQVLGIIEHAEAGSTAELQ